MPDIHTLFLGMFVFDSKKASLKLFTEFLRIIGMIISPKKLPFLAAPLVFINI